MAKVINNTGRFVKGEKKKNQGKRGPDKVGLEVKKILAQAIEAEFEHIGPTLRKVKAKNPVMYLKCLSSLMEYVVPKQARVEHSGEGGQPLIPIITIVASGSKPINDEKDLA